LITAAVTEGHPRRRQILAVLCLALLIVVIDNTILNTALPTLARELGAGPTDLQWIVDSYTLVFAALVIVAGAWGDRFGRRRGLMLGLVLFAAGSAAAALAGSAAELIAFRAVMGVGAALVMPATLSILSDVFAPAERPAAIGIWSAMAGIAVVAGPTLGGLLLDHFSWSSAFWINVPLAAIALAATVAIVPALPGRRTAGRLDLIGAGLSALAMLALVDAIIEGPERGWLAARTVAELALGIALVGAFIRWELRAPAPLIDVRIFAQRAFSAATSAVALSFFALYGALFALTQYLQFVKGYSPLTAGLGALPFAGAMLLASPLSPVLAGRLGARMVVPVGLSLMGTGLMVATQLEPATSYAQVAVAVALMGAGMGLTLAPASESMIGVLPREQAGAGSAVNDTVQELGGTLGVAVIGSVVAAAFRSGIDDARLPPTIADHARGSIADAEAVAANAGPLAGQVADVAHEAFATAMTNGFCIAAGAAFAGAALAAALLPRRAPTVKQATAADAAAA
jgi:EmrB/QacA subfamily drug resistance transporter